MSERDLDALIRDLREIVQTVCACAKHSSRVQTCAACIAADTATKAADAIAALRARAERDKADAERYRWLRNWPDNDYDVLHVCANRAGPDPHGEELDAEIDAAIDRARGGSK